MEHIHELLTAMKPLLEQYGYFALVISIALEGIGIPLPGQSLMIAASIISSEHKMSISVVIVVSWLSCFFGNTCGYLIGYHFESWLDKKGDISGPRMQKLQSIIEKYGPACLVISRFVEGMKQFMPLACGIAKMPRKEFLIGNAIATTTWVCVFSLLTHFAVEHLNVFSQFYNSHRYIVWACTALLFIALIFLLLKKTKSHYSR